MKLTFGKVLLLITLLIYASLIGFFSFILTPRWEFTVSTGKTVYTAGEEVRITVTLKNVGYATQSVTSAIAGPIIVYLRSVDPEINDAPEWIIWCTPLEITKNETTFTIAANDVLVRTILWNQSWLTENLTGYPAPYHVHAIIPEANLASWIWIVNIEYSPQFSAYTEFTVVPSVILPAP